MLTSCPEVASYPLDDELVLYDERSGHAYVLNRTGRQIWSLCDGTRTTAALARVIAADFGIAYQRVCSDVAELVAELRDRGLLLNQRERLC